MTRRTTEVERARAQAAQLLDRASTVMSRAKLIDVALRDYAARFACSAASRPTQPWLFYDGNPDTVGIPDDAERVDVYCVFCRVMLVNGANLKVDYTAQVSKHTTQCALMCLAKRMEPGAPGTYRLPEEL